MTGKYLFRTTNLEISAHANCGPINQSINQFILSNFSINTILPADSLLYYTLFQPGRGIFQGGRSGMFSLIHCFAFFLKTGTLEVLARLTGSWL